MKNLILFMLSFFINITMLAQPIAVQDFDTLYEDSFSTIDVLINDTYSPLTDNIFITTTPIYGTAIINASNEIVYTPNANFYGSDNIIYMITNGIDFDYGVVIITITPVNDAPTISLSSQVTPQNTALNICPNIADVDDPLTNLYIGGSTLTVNPNSSVTGPDAFNCFVYTPDFNYNGIDNVLFFVCDQYLCDSVIVPITVTPLNTAPLAVDDNISTLINTYVVIDVLANDTDNSNIDPTSVIIINNTVNGNTNIDPTTGQITYTPNQSFVGTEIITYSICDDGNPLPALCDTADIYITVTPLSVEGTIMSSSATPLQNSIVYLIEQNGNLLFIDQTTITDANGFYQFYNVPQTFYIKAIPDQTLFPTDVPTYYLNSGVFQYSTAISPTISPFTANFNTTAGLNPGGAGFVAGFVGQGAGKNNAEGDPVADLDIVLVNTNSSIVVHTKTDAQGMFEFDNLEIADYSIWVDNGSVDNANAPLISLSKNASQTDLKFALEEEALELITSTSIKELSESSFKLFPNPINDGVINITSLENSNDLQIEIRSISGELVFKNQFKTQNIKIDLLKKGFSKGTYFLKLKTKNTTYVSKVILN